MIKFILRIIACIILVIIFITYGILHLIINCILGIKCNSDTFDGIYNAISQDIWINYKYKH